MKKNDWILGIAVLSYSFLFYHQFAGINFLLFNLILVFSLLIKDRHFLKKTEIRLPLAGALLSAVCIVLYGDGLSVFANILSLSLLAANNMNSGNSIVAAAIHALYSYISAPFYMVSDAIQRRKNTLQDITISPKPGVLFYLIPVLMVALFFMFYRGSSVLFENLTDQIRIDFISFGFIFFTLGGAILLYAFYYNKRINSLVQLEQQQRDYIERTGLQVYKVFGFSIELPTERKSGILMLAALNLLILVVNALDIQFLVLDTFPANMNYSELVHQGVGSLIMSIITAIAIILWYFKGEQNFAEDNILKTLAYIWIAQNVLMIATSGYKNFLYIEEASLTYKRIGVFVYLLLAVIGLLTTWYKLSSIKSGWYLFKTNAAAWYVVLVVFCFVNWDVWIVRYNINRANETKKPLDVVYLASLSDKVIPDLYPYLTQNREHNDSQEGLMRTRIYRILTEEPMVDWRSWNADRKRIVEGIRMLFKNGFVDDLSKEMDFEIPYPDRITRLRIYNPGYDRILITGLKPYTNLHTLDMSETNMNSLQGLPVLNHLHTLDVSNNRIVILKPITKCTNLVDLDVSSNEISYLPDLSDLQQLKRLDLSHNDIKDFSGLSALSNLEYLDISYTMPANFSFLKGMVNLKTLVINSYNQDQLKFIKTTLPEVKIQHLSEQ